MKSFYWDCCRIEKSVARDGTVTAYNEWPGYPADSEVVYLSQGQLPGADGNHPAHYTRTDAIGREIESTSYVADPQFGYHFGYAEQVTTTAYPFGTDNFSVATDPQGICTTNITTWNNATNITVTSRAGITTTDIAIAGGAKITTTEWTDSVSGEQLKKMTKTESDIQPNDWKKTTSYVKYDDGEWLTQSETTHDFLGRVIATTTPLGTTTNFYDLASGRLIKGSRTGSADTLYEYNSLGEQTVTCQDVNKNGAVDYAGLDRINKIDRIYELRSNDWWQVTYNEVWVETNSANCITSSVSRVRMTGLGADTYNGGVLTAQSESEDWLGNITRSSTYTDAANATTWQVTDTPISTQNAFQKSIAGYPVQTISTTSVTNTFTYDGFAQQVTATDGRTNTTFTAYNDFGQVSYTQSFTNRMSYFYDDLGRRTAVSNALGQVSHTAYNSQGQTIATWGTSYPVAYEFNTAGRMIAMATTRSNEYANVNLNTLVPTGETLSSFSTQNSALDVTQWIYDETTGLLTNKLYTDGNRTTYTYTDAGRLATRTWARGITTTYIYGDLGQLTDINYSDSTPDVTFTHDRLDRIISASSSTSARTFHYDGLTLDYETQDGDIIDRKQDSFGRTIGYILTGGPLSPMTLTYSFDEYGRLSSVTSIIGIETNTFAYTYLPGTDLVNAMSSDSGVQWSRYYESERNLIIAVSNSWNATTISAFDYINDQLGSRTHRADYFNASTITNDFIYNIRGEVRGAIMGNDNHSYSNDPIGNREWNQLNGSTNTYVANQLNQYTSITGGISASPTHDDDGNMTFSSSWFYTWDGENRLISASNLTSGVFCEYAYDYQSRRISKTTLTPNPYSSLITKYIWDGWNVAAEIIVDQTTFTTNINYYTWGLDLSSTLQGAGGVGGLLSDTKIASSETNTYFAVGDANGNITEYVDVSGNIKAHGEHNAFGETKLSGSMKDDFTHWFSTKPFDADTGLIVYQRRYYEPILFRFLSRDPIKERGGNNLYLLGNNDAINKWDYLGMQRALSNATLKRYGFIIPWDFAEANV
ncbi:MAG: hypothetical protein PHO37_10395 [Kiritimatiellae bacterium]|nr:hypothetical protein [Kiritimatiellia bacterium]